MPDDQRTFIMIKPDGVRRRLIGEVMRRIEAKGYDIRDLRMFTIDESLAKQHYAEHVDKPFFDDLVSFITSGPVVAMIVEGANAIKGMDQLVGATDPLDAAPGSIRGDLASVLTENIVHRSDSPGSAEREVKLFFG